MRIFYKEEEQWVVEANDSARTIVSIQNTNGDPCERGKHACYTHAHTQPAHTIIRAPSTYKVYSNRGNVGFRVRIVGKPEQQAGFSYTRVSNEEEFEQVIAAHTQVSS